MCTKEEVREIVLENKTPQWTLYLLAFVGTCILTLLSWLAIEVHEQDGNLETAIRDISSAQLLNTSELEKSLHKSSSAQLLIVAKLTSRIEVLTAEFNNTKQISLDRSADRYTGREARSRNALVDERCRTQDERIKKVEHIVREHHEDHEKHALRIE